MFSKTVYIETPEMQTAKDNKKQEKHELFSEMFTNTFGLLLLILLTYSTLTIAFSREKIMVIPEENKTLFTTPPIDIGGSTFSNENSTINEVISQTKGSSHQESSTVGGTVNNENKPSIIGKNINVIVPYFANSMNMVKSQSKSVTNTWKNATNYNDIVNVNGSAILQKAAQSLMNTFLKEETPNTGYSSKDDISTFFPPANKTSCGLQESDVDSAECTDNGSTYKITLKLKADTNPDYGHGSGAVANILTANQITDPLPSFIKISNVQCAYQGSIVQAEIERSTGRILNYYTNLPMIMSFTAMSMDGSIGLQFEEKWEIAW